MVTPVPFSTLLLCSLVRRPENKLSTKWFRRMNAVAASNDGDEEDIMNLLMTHWKEDNGMIRLIILR